MRRIQRSIHPLVDGILTNLGSEINRKLDSVNPAIFYLMNMHLYTESS